MGYKRTQRTTLLKWAEGEELHGLEVELRELTVDRWLALNRLSAELVQMEKADSPPAQMGAKAEEFFGQFAGALQSWNLEDGDGTPVPATREGVGAQGLQFVLKLAMAWVGAAGSVDTPLPPGSANGHSTAPVPPIPMEPLPSS